MEKKIALIGAGSHFTIGLVYDIIYFKDLEGSTVGLIDTDAKGLKNVERIIQRMISQTGADLHVTASTDRKQILEGCDFVIMSIAVGNHWDAWKLDLDIPAKYGIYQTVGDSVGPGGISRAFRTVPEVLEICRDMEDLCPEAFLFNFTNPNTCVCRSINRATKIKAVGLCHGLFHTTRFLCKVLGIPVPDVQYAIPEGVNVTAAGVNHLTWILDLRINGQDAYPMLRERLSKPDAMTMLLDWDPHRKFYQSYELFKIFGYWPSCYDRHICEFFPWFLRKNGRLDLVDKIWSIEELEKGWQGRLSPDLWYFKEYVERERKEAADYAEGKLPIEKVLKRSGEIAVPAISSIIYDRNEIGFAVNIPNKGYVTNLPNDVVLEVPGIFGRYGIRGIGLGDLPKGIDGILQKRVLQQELTVEAALTGDRDIAIQAMLLDELTPSLGVARKVLDELLGAHASRLPDYWFK